ncbi:hypothetical protein Godav_023187 [Gossypium davidsonii]|uniref:Uncharacterized protein n=1 Tax=Gossypium davidsonii TaxID=34287 RepID=A0A7J8SRC3_GOSDV|nr:hypothetical protein [Gossypium davidsonii]
MLSFRSKSMTCHRALCQKQWHDDLDLSWVIFFVYDTRVPSLGLKQYMRLKVCLDVRLAFKQKKKVIKLGHGESFYLVRVRVDSSQIVFRWDITLRAPTRKGSMRVSCWLRKSDRTRSSTNEGILLGIHGITTKGFGPSGFEPSVAGLMEI